MHNSTALISSLALVVVLTAAACGGAAAPTATPTRAPTPSPTTGPAPTATRPASQPTPTPTVPATSTPVPATPTPTQRAPTSRGKMIYAKPVDIGRTTTVPPGFGAGGPDTLFNSSLDAGLISLSMEGKLVPWAAKSWDFSSDQKVVTFTLRDDVIFHDGTKATVDDWLYRLDDLWLHPVQPGAAAPSRQPVPDRIEKTGPLTIRIVFPQPNPWFMDEVLRIEQSTGLSVHPKAYIQRVGLDEFYKRPIGAGPYKLADRRPADRVVLEAHEQFFNGAPPVKTIEVRIVPEDSTRMAMFLTGEADIGESIPPQMLPQIQRVEGAKVLGVRSGYEVVIQFLTAVANVPGTDKPNPFRDIRVRRAFAHAVDRKAILERIAGRAGEPVKGPWSSFHLGYDGGSITDYEYSPEKAKQLLKEAGYDLKTPVKVYSYQASAPAPAAVEAFANYMQDIGVNAVYTNIEVATLIRMWSSRTAYPMSFIRGWGIRPDPSGHYFAWVAGMSPGGFTDDSEMDALYNQANSIAEPGAHNEALKKLYRYLHDKAYVINLFALVDNHAIGKRVDWRYPPGLPSRFDLVTWR